jgi:hypothetical protein
MMDGKQAGNQSLSICRERNYGNIFSISPVRGTVLKMD